MSCVHNFTISSLGHGIWKCGFKWIPYQALYKCNYYYSVPTWVSLVCSHCIRFCGTLNINLNRLQTVQNAAARLLTGLRKHDHISPVLAELHWLPVKSRIDFKVLLHTFKAIHGQTPGYVSSLIERRHLRPGLRSSGLTLQMPITHLRGYGDRAFSSIARRLWNSLPSSIREIDNLDHFKASLKLTSPFRHLNAYFIGGARAFECFFKQIYGAIQMLWIIINIIIIIINLMDLPSWWIHWWCYGECPHALRGAAHRLQAPGPCNIPWDFLNEAR